MSGGFLIAPDDRLYDRAARTLQELGAVSSLDDLGGGVSQFADEGGRLFTLYERVPDGTDWEVREGALVSASGAQLPDMRLVTACPFECRWPDLAVRIVGEIAQVGDSPTWVLDGDGVVWDARDVDPSKVQL